MLYREYVEYIYLFNDGLTCMLMVWVCGPGTYWVSVCRPVWRVSLRWLERIVGWVHWSSAYRSISYVVVVLACKMTPNSSLLFLYLTLLITSVCSGLPYSCQLLRMCNAYAETGLFVFMYHIYSRCLIFVDLLVWQTYDLLHILHCNLYIPLQFILFCGDLWHSWLCMALHVRNVMFRSVRLNRLVTLCGSGLWYVNVMHCVCVGVFFVFYVLIILSIVDDL